MARALSFRALALALALGACDDDAPANEECDDCTLEDAGGKSDARAPRKDASDDPPDAGPIDDDDASATDAGSKDAGPKDAGSDAASSDASVPGDAFESARQTCLDTINTYRATKSLPPMKRASAEGEACSDDGAEFDSTKNKAHGSATKGSIPCRTSSIAQNTCPNWPVGKNGTLEKTLQSCLAQMWAEGEPPTTPCTGTCFQEHGHYLNMTSTNTTVSCGFFQNAKGEWWMNQDFTR